MFRSSASARGRVFATIASLAALSAGSAALANSVYERHVVFDNTRGVGWYLYSAGDAVAPSRIDLVNGKLPLETKLTHSPPNALRLSWTSKQGGNWRASIEGARIWGTQTDFQGDALTFWIYSDSDIDAGSSPRIRLEDLKGVGNPAIDLIGALPKIPAKTWTKVVLPFVDFKSAVKNTSDEKLDPRQFARMTIVQGLDDGQPHSMVIDDIRIEDEAKADPSPPTAPAVLSARGYERHVELSWRPSPSPDTESYRIYRSVAGKPFEWVASQRVGWNRYEDFVGPVGVKPAYRITAVDSAGNESAVTRTVAAQTHAMTDDQLMTMIEEAQFRYYWDGAHPNAGMGLEITPGDPDQVAMGGSGFGVMALIVGTDRGFVTRDQGAERMLKIVRFLKSADRFHGVWPHYLNGNTGKVMPVFGKYDDGGDLIETAFMMQGLLTARQYFTRDTAAEREIRDTIASLWNGVEWDWYRQRPDSDFLYWHWSPDYGFYINHPLVGWNESAIAYILGIASPTHPVPASLWHSGWAGTSPRAIKYRQGWSRTTDGDHFVNGHSYYGYKLEVGEGNGAELFFTQFSFLGFDPRGKRDAYTNYFKNNRTIALISHAYAIDNPRKWTGYGDDAWGQSAGVNNGGGRAQPRDDNGTITVHAALASMPYTPEESLKALRHYYRDLGPRIYGTYGFSDTFNESQGFYDETYMALDQAQTVAMIENYRTGLLWKLFMSSPEIQPALDKIGFKPDP
jgi:hypothetical protein